MQVMDFGAAKCQLWVYDPAANTSADYTQREAEWDEVMAGPSDLVPVQVFIFESGGVAVTDELGATCWFNADAREKDIGKAIIQWHTVVGLMHAAEE